MARRAGCGVAAKGGVIDGCYAAYTTSVTFGDSFSSRRSLCAFGAINNNLPYLFCSSQMSSTAISAGETPEILPAWPMDMGLMALSFSLASSRRPPMVL